MLGRRANTLPLRRLLPLQAQRRLRRRTRLGWAGKRHHMHLAQLLHSRYDSGRADLAPMRVLLTHEQRLALRHFFPALGHWAALVAPGMLLAQVYTDHMRVGLVHPERAAAIAKLPIQSVKEIR